MIIPNSDLQLFVPSPHRSAFWRFAVLCAIAFAMLSQSAHAQCTAANTPTIVEVDHQPNSTQVTIRWYWVGDTFCVYPQDFYQVRWTKGEGPETQNQSPQIETTSNSATFTLPGIDPDALYGFIVQACVNRTFASANCTRWSPMAYYKPYGSGMCRYGFVWRGAIANDKVCVTPQTRSEAAADNAASPGRTKPDGFCIYGFVWRQVIPSDHVCVVPETRSQAVFDNAQAYLHTLPPP